MNKKTIPLDYANDLMYDLEKALWDERGRGVFLSIENEAICYSKTRPF